MLDKSNLTELMDFAYKLSQGIDPCSGEIFDSDTILNRRNIKEYNYSIYTLLKGMLSDNSKPSSQQNVEIKSKAPKQSIGKSPIILSDDEIEAFEYFDEPVSISKLIYYVNGKHIGKRKLLHAKDITFWLAENDYLESVSDNNSNKYYKIATKKGNDIGIKTYIKTNSYGNDYSVNLYNKTAQRFV